MPLRRWGTSPANSGPVSTGSMRAGSRHQRRQARDEIQRLENRVGGAFPIGRLRYAGRLALAGEGRPARGNRRPGDVAAQPLDLFPVICTGGHARA